MSRAMPRKAKHAFGAKAAFVRAHPSTPAAELVQLAEQEGMALTVGHIYNIRSKQKKQGGEAVSAGAEPVAVAPATRGDSSSLDAQLRTLVIRIGLDRAERVFSELKASLARVV
jgi:hypothetical protein